MFAANLAIVVHCLLNYSSLITEPRGARPILILEIPWETCFWRCTLATEL